MEERHQRDKDEKEQEHKPDEQALDQLESIPDEVLQNIMEFLSPSELAKLKLVSRRIKANVDDYIKRANQRREHEFELLTESPEQVVKQLSNLLAPEVHDFLAHYRLGPHYLNLAKKSFDEMSFWEVICYVLTRKADGPIIIKKGDNEIYLSAMLIQAISNEAYKTLDPAMLKNVEIMLAHLKLLEFVQNNPKKNLYQTSNWPFVSPNKKAILISLLKIKHDKDNKIFLNLSGAQLSHVDFSYNNFNLMGIDLSGANLMHCNLRATNLSTSNLSGACLDKDDLRETILQHTNLSDASLKDTDFDEATLDHTNLTHADLTEASRLPYIHSTNAFLTQANLINISGFFRLDLPGQNLHGLCLKDSPLTESNLASSNLSGADFTNAVLKRSVLSGANLIGSNFSNATLEDIDLSYANLTGAKLNGIKLKHCNLMGIILLSIKENASLMETEELFTQIKNQLDFLANQIKGHVQEEQFRAAIVANIKSLIHFLQNEKKEPDYEKQFAIINKLIKELIKPEHPHPVHAIFAHRSTPSRLTATIMQTAGKSHDTKSQKALIKFRDEIAKKLPEYDFEIIDRPPGKGKT